MGAGYSATAQRLWRTSFYWKYSVYGAGVFTFMSLIYLSTGHADDGARPAPSPPPMPAVLTPDPASDARLTDYEGEYAKAAKVAAAGARCERVATAYEALTADDLRRGRDIRASPAGRIKALADGERCHDDIAKSDQHFVAVAKAVSAAQADETPQTFQAAASALRALDRFDKPRERFHADAAVIASAQSFSDALAASDAKLTTLASTVAAFERDSSPTNALAASEALNHLMKFDHDRIVTVQQQAMLAKANTAERLVADGRSRLAHLGRALTAAQTNTSSVVKQQLIDAVTSINRFDEGLADQNQKQMLEQAQALALADAWSTAQDCLAAIQKEKDPKVADYERAAAIYRILQRLPQSQTTDEQKAILGRLQSATDFVTESDQRRHILLDAYAQWKQRGVQAGDVVIGALHPIGKFDRDRFHPDEQQAWDTLNKAATILQGPELGYSATTAASMPIFCTSLEGGELGERVAKVLRASLQQAGVKTTPNRDEAVLILNTAPGEASTPTPYLDDGIFQYQAAVRVTFRLFWAADESATILADEVNEAGKSKNQQDTKIISLEADIAAITRKIRDLSVPKKSP